ncbi:MAG: hypothetical protein QOD03_35 [Verrucomicrobiota bacterium]|jgi:hypothetical protein
MFLKILRFVNKLLAIFLLVGALGSFGLSQRESYQSQEHTARGGPIGQPRTVYITQGEKVGYISFGILFMFGGIYFATKALRDVRK